MDEKSVQPPSYQQATASAVYVQGLTPQLPIIIQQQPPQPQVKHFIHYPSSLGRQPTALTCPRCHAYVMTDTEAVEGTGCCLAFTVGTILSCSGLGCILCCLVCCSEATHDITHRCPKCHTTLGMNKRL